MKPIKSRIAIKRARNNTPVVNVSSGSQPHWALLLLTALSALVTPIVVAIMTSRTTQSSTDKDYVSLAVNILNSKSSTEENRKWAFKLLTKLSPVPFSSASEEQLANGGGLTVGPLYGPNHPFVKKSELYIRPCLPINGPKNQSWSNKDIEKYIYNLSKAYADCANNHRIAVAMIDILQNTYHTPATIAFDAKTLGSYVIERIRMGPDSK